MTKNTLWTILAVIGAIVIAWFVVDVAFSVLAFAFKVAVVAVVAVVVYVVLRMLFRSSD